MVAAPRLRRRDNVFRPDLEEDTSFPPLLKAAAIYGSNASGKSNLVKALNVVSTIAKLKPSATPDKLPVEPFRFNPALRATASRFEISFIRGRRRYRFTLAASKERVEEERLVAFPRGKETLLYARYYREGRDQYEFGGQLEGGKDLHETWSKLTGPTRLFISQAVANSSESLQQLRIPFSWLTRGISTMTGTTMQQLVGPLQEMLREDSSLTKSIIGFVNDLDIPLTEMRFDANTTDQDEFEVGSKATAERSTLSAQTSGGKTVFTHKTALGEAVFDLDEESTGTQHLIGFFLPWYVLKAARDTAWRVLVVDELDTSLHPNIVAELIRRHLQNSAPGQLIFTTHDTHLMDTKILRRDQIWLTERDMNGATQLRSVHDFEGRESEDIEKRYYEGRYRGLPIVRTE
jgi:energy-coupling factor transporter ATP-binding protein EcfA2